MAGLIWSGTAAGCRDVESSMKHTAVLVVLAVLNAACSSSDSSTASVSTTSVSAGPLSSVSSAVDTSVPVAAVTPAVVSVAETTKSMASAEPSIVATIPVADGLDAIATADGRVWVASQSGTEIVAIDEASNTIVGHIPRSDTRAMTVDLNPAGSPTDPRPLYVCSAVDTVKIDTRRAKIVETYPYGCSHGIVVGSGAIWIESDTQLVELGPSGDLVATVPIQAGSWGVGAAAESIWIVSGSSGSSTVTRINSGSHDTIATIALPGNARNIVATDTAVWVTTQPSDNAKDTTSLVRIDPATNTIADRYSEGTGGIGLDMSGRYLWVVGSDGAVFVIDTSTNHVVARPQLMSVGTDPGANGVVAADGSVWLTAQQPGAVIRVDPGGFGDRIRRYDAPPSTRIDVAHGCPTSIATAASLYSHPFANPDQTGLDTTLVPGVPTAAVICHYSAVNFAATGHGSNAVIGGSLLDATTLDATHAQTLASTANSTEPAPFVSTCTPDLDGPEYTVMAFSIPNRADVDVWYKDYAGCPNLTNGVHDVSPLINGYGTTFVTLLDADTNASHVDGGTSPN